MGLQFCLNLYKRSAASLSLLSEIELVPKLHLPISHKIGTILPIKYFTAKLGKWQIDHNHLDHSSYHCTHTAMTGRFITIAANMVSITVLLKSKDNSLLWIFSGQLHGLSITLHEHSA